MEKLNQRLPNEAKTVWMIQGILTFLVLIILLIGYFIARFAFYDHLPLWPTIVFGSFIVLLAIMQIFITPVIKMHYWGYDLREHEIEIQYGIIIIRRTLIPMSRIQHVDTEHGPIQRRFKLATLSISTAGSNHKIPALKEDVAQALRNDIARLAELSDQDD